MIGFTGVRIVDCFHMPEFTVKSNREHVRKPWMTGTYHNRIQKKWDKRFGTKKVRYLINNQGTIYAHPETVRFIKDSFDGYDVPPQIQPEPVVLPASATMQWDLQKIGLAMKHPSTLVNLGSIV